MADLSVLAGHVGAYLRDQRLRSLRGALRLLDALLGRRQRENLDPLQERQLGLLGLLQGLLHALHLLAGRLDRLLHGNALELRLQDRGGAVKLLLDARGPVPHLCQLLPQGPLLCGLHLLLQGLQDGHEVGLLRLDDLLGGGNLVLRHLALRPRLAHHRGLLDLELGGPNLVGQVLQGLLSLHTLPERRPEILVRIQLLLSLRELLLQVRELEQGALARLWGKTARRLQLQVDLLAGLRYLGLGVCGRRLDLRHRVLQGVAGLVRRIRHEGRRQDRQRLRRVLGGGHQLLCHRQYL
mmetsp:Transcript_99689/g.282103  ORF Transcript_99689/g.282103 Transcript_99689/m.282103 type:complete len:296 (+) Transcript_99689:615-1502(+)